MRSTWIALRLALLAIAVAYFVLAFIAARRFYGRKRARSTDVMFWVIVVLVMIRIFAGFTSVNDWIYRLIVLLPGIAAAIGIPGLLKELGSLKAGDGNPADGNEARFG
jgi:hypothetical protein